VALVVVKGLVRTVVTIAVRIRTFSVLAPTKFILLRSKEVTQRAFMRTENPGVLVNASLKDDDDIQRLVELLFCAVNKLRGNGVTHRGVSYLPGRLNVKTGPLLSLFLLRFFVFHSVFLLIWVLVSRACTRTRWG